MNTAAEIFMPGRTFLARSATAATTAAAAAVALGVFLLDQALKAWVLRAPLPCEVLPFLRFVLVINRGALFGLLAEGWASPLLLLCTALGTVAVGWLLWRAWS